jgi:hypothetical protein
MSSSTFSATGAVLKPNGESEPAPWFEDSTTAPKGD